MKHEARSTKHEAVPPHVNRPTGELANRRIGEVGAHIPISICDVVTMLDSIKTCMHGYVTRRREKKKDDETRFCSLFPLSLTDGFAVCSTRDHDLGGRDRVGAWAYVHMSVCVCVLYYSSGVLGGLLDVPNFYFYSIPSGACPVLLQFWFNFAATALWYFLHVSCFVGPPASTSSYSALIYITLHNALPSPLPKQPPSFTSKHNSRKRPLQRAERDQDRGRRRQHRQQQRRRPRPAADPRASSCP